MIARGQPLPARTAKAVPALAQDGQRLVRPCGSIPGAVLSVLAGRNRDA